jgi:lipase
MRPTVGPADDHGEAAVPTITSSKRSSVPRSNGLRRTFTNRASYQHFWREHPAFCDPDIWTPEVEAYLDYDLVGEPPLLRSGVSLDAVRRDSQDTLGDSARGAAAAAARCC